jgi:hypothetical protein
MHIGTDIAGTAALGNFGSGVLINGSENTVSLAKVVYNGADGISVVTGTGNDVSFTGAQGAIHSNGDQAIDIGTDGFTPNDANDSDGGSNNSQNSPVLTAVSFANGAVTVSGTLTTNPRLTVSLDFFANPIAAREGRFPLVRPSGADPEITTGTQGTASFTFTLVRADGVPLTAENFVTAVATVGPDEGRLSLSSSEFSPRSAPRPRRGCSRCSSMQLVGTGLPDVHADYRRWLHHARLRRAANNQLDELPWTNLNQVSIQFTERSPFPQQPVDPGRERRQLHGWGATYDAVTMTATWQLSSGAFAVDKLVLDLASTVTDANSNALDGEWPGLTANAFPSGNGTAGGNFQFRLNVLPGA